jgi:hypothetical protein
MTKLTVGFQFHLPYLAREGHPTTLSVSTGPDITVNTILGLPFIQQTCMVINASDQVADLCTLNIPPFSIDFRQAMCTVPVVDSAPNNQCTSVQYANIITEVDNIVALHSTKSQPTSILLSEKRFHCVDFNNTSVAPAIGDKLSTATIGSAIKPKYSYDPDSFSLFDLPCSA